ncbi:hypothetical protein F4559_002807 [Saccharothrix violaceirubra]|uniref:Uncharacterized protein n=1 Tax=Saccharothrix violaceirubra TaxID=413306 RepID=A0A7W7WWD0_9PSEU|nr:hypothetical protein [Saccharothrix violaceirubra]
MVGFPPFTGWSTIRPGESAVFGISPEPDS